jgi:predicted DNA-binding transcriptional regulator AlpA
MRALLNDTELARLTGRSRSAWQKDRHKNQPTIPFIKCGRLIRYDMDDVEAWLKQNRVTYREPIDA